MKFTNSNIIKFLSISIVLFLTLATIVLAEEKTILLKDGTNIKGEIISMTNGVYTVKTKNLGQLSVEEANIVSIQSPQVSSNSQTNQQAPGNFNNQIQQMQNQIIANPQMMQSIQEMMQDPKVMEILQDETFMNAVKSQDIKAIENNPRTEELINNPKIQDLIKQFGNSAK